MGGGPEYTLPIGDGYLFSLKNVGSGKYLIVHNGTDADGTNVCQWDKDESDSDKQRFIALDVANDPEAGPIFKFYAKCSSNGSNRILRVEGSSVTHGCNVEINSPMDDDGELWELISTGEGYQVFPKGCTALALSSYGTSNGSASGRATDSDGNIFISTYTGSDNQLWEVIPKPPVPKEDGTRLIYVDTPVQGCIEETGSADYYVFTPEVTGPHTIQFSAISDETTLHAFLYHSVGGTLLVEDYGATGFNITYDLQQNEHYYIRVIRRWDQGRINQYTLEVKSPQLLHVDTPVQGCIEATGSADCYMFTPEVTGPHTIQFTEISDDTTIHAFLYHSVGGTLLAEDYGATGFNITYDLQQNENYYIRIIRRWDEGIVEEYTLEVKSPPLYGKKILIDPGHGGAQPGAEGSLDGVPIIEKDLTLIFSLALRDRLVQDRATVIMTRTEDISIGTDERWLIGRDNNVDAVVSVHFNSNANDAVKGIETYYALPRLDTPYVDKLFADKVHAAMRDTLSAWIGEPMLDGGVIDDTKSYLKSLGILRYPQGTSYLYPRCLVEVEYLSNEEAMGKLVPFADAAQHFADGVTRGLSEFFGA